MKETHTNANGLDWKAADGYPEGAKIKVLHEGSEDTPRAFLLKMKPGWMMNEHSHVHAEIHYVLEGEYESHDKVYTAGSIRMIPEHADHGPFTTIRGAVVLVIALNYVP